MAELRRILGENLIDSPAVLAAYECDGLSAYRQLPLAVALPQSVEQVSAVLAVCNQHEVKIVPRGAGTSLSGGATPIEGGIVLGVSKLNRILEVDYANRCVTVQPGVSNAAISRAVAAEGFYYAPDPSSQIVCTIGGNVAENAGGVHCLKYGLTTNNLLGVELVLADGTVLRLGGKSAEAEGYDLLGLVCGSEGLLGIITEVTVRILPKPLTQRALMVGFSTVEEAGACVSAIISNGIIPAALEIMDELSVHAAEDFVQAGYPRNVGALLIAEYDGTAAEVDEMIGTTSRIAEQNGASYVRASETEEERELIWKGRKAAFPAVGRVAPDYYCVDGTIPRRALPEVLTRIADIGARHGLRVANVFHAGDGNLHPMILYDASVPGQLELAEEVGAEILRTCVDAGGVLTGEHGVGLEKVALMHYQFGQVDLDQQARVKCAFDPTNLLNPGKMLPELCRCAELGKMHVHQGELRFPELSRL